MLAIAVELRCDTHGCDAHAHGSAHVDSRRFDVRRLDVPRGWHAGDCVLCPACLAKRDEEARERWRADFVRGLVHLKPGRDLTAFGLSLLVPAGSRLWLDGDDIWHDDGRGPERIDPEKPRVLYGVDWSVDPHGIAARVRGTLRECGGEVAP